MVSPSFLFSFIRTLPLVVTFSSFLVSSGVGSVEMSAYPEAGSLTLMVTFSSRPVMVSLSRGGSQVDFLRIRLVGSLNVPGTAGKFAVGVMVRLRELAG